MRSKLPTQFVIHYFGNRKKPFERAVPTYYQPPKMKGKYMPHQNRLEKKRRAKHNRSVNMLGGV